MADKSAIEWTDATWNPTVGCSIVSPGCTNCYAMKVANGLERRFDSPKYRGLTKVVNGNAVWTGEVRLDEAALLQPLKWKRGRRIFVNSMSDLFHEALEDWQIAMVFGVMTCAVQHDYQVLTKRADRMRTLLSSESFWDQVNAFSTENAMENSDTFNRRTDDYRATSDDHDPENPPVNIWLGISAERQEEADERLPHLVNTPAAVRFVSYEPALGPLSLQGCRGVIVRNWLGQGGVDWVICGGESGPNARPMHPQWARDIRDQCQAAGVPFFFKQRGEYTWIDVGCDDDRVPDLPQNWRERKDDKFICMRADGSRADGYGGDSAEFLYRVGKKAAGRLLDGVTHDGFPEVRSCS